jgi:protein BUR2
VEETCRKIKEVVVACVRVALKDPNKLVDDQTKDFWKWRDTILYSEDLVLETLCFDLSVTPPYKPMYDMLGYLGLQHDKKVRNAAWAFLSDADSTQLCLLFNSRTIAAAAIYAGTKFTRVEIPAEADGSPWWKAQYVELKDIRRAVEMMADIYEASPPKDGEERNMYQGLKSPEGSFGMQTPSSQVGLGYEATPKHSQPEPQGSLSVDARNGGDVPMGNAAANGAEPAAPNGNAQASADDDASEEGELAE